MIKLLFFLLLNNDMYDCFLGKNDSNKSLNLKLNIWKKNDDIPEGKVIQYIIYLYTLNHEVL